MFSASLKRRVSQAASCLLLLGLLAACAGGVPSSPSQPFFFPSRVSVQDIRVTPGVAAAGVPVRIQFRLVRAADDASPIYWSAHLFERPSAGGLLSASTGGPVISGTLVELTYLPAASTIAVVTLYPSSTPGGATGDGSGDWRSFSIEVR